MSYYLREEVKGSDVIIISLLVKQISLTLLLQDSFQKNTKFYSEPLDHIVLLV